ncbi:MAG: hypothetical protein ABT940_10985 [Alphaproteobacteria bacterium]
MPDRDPHQLKKDLPLAGRSALVIESSRHSGWEQRCKTWLRMWGAVRIDGAENVPIAESYLSRLTPDIILCPFSIVPSGGVDFVRTLRSGAAGGHCGIPVVMVLDRDEADHMGEAWQAGVTSFVIAPHKPEEILDAVLEVLEGPPRKREPVRVMRTPLFTAVTRIGRSDVSYPAAEEVVREASDIGPACSQMEVFRKLQGGGG